MASTGPFVVLLGVALSAGLSQADINSWILGAYGLGGCLTVIFSLLYRMPMGMAWTIPGTVLLGGALQHLPFDECIGAFYACGILVSVLGLSGGVSRLSRLIPLNIVMAMVAGVFLPFVTKIVSGFEADWLVASVTVGVFVLGSAQRAIARVAPPILLAIVAGAAVVAIKGQFSFDVPVSLSLAKPVFYTPVFTWRAIIELTVPLTITVVGIHNLQGFAISEANGYRAPRNVLTTVCGFATFVYAAIGTVPTCVTGPANGILNVSGEKERRYAGGLVFGALMILFGVFAPITTATALALPVAFIGLVGGLAMFDVVRAAFLHAFSGKLSVGALTTFVVTVADRPIANIGAPFWAIVFGLAVAYLLERDTLHGR